MTHQPAALDVCDLRHSYGERPSLRGVTFTVRQGETFGLLGPNGGGKTTLFRIISTLMLPTAGIVRVFGIDVVRRPSEVRRRIGVVFQSPALDVRLTVAENLRHHGHLYGMYGPSLRARIGDALAHVGLEDRAGDLIQHLSGGLRRRAELAKALLPQPEVLVLDEPSTGLDPAARREIRDHLQHLQQHAGTTIILTTHLMDEASWCHRLAILDEGLLVCLGSPAELIETVGGEVILIDTSDPESLAGRIAAQYGLRVDVVDGRLRIERRRAHEFVTELVERYPGEIETVSFGKPTLEDVFVHYTGKSWRRAGASRGAGF